MLTNIYINVCSGSLIFIAYYNQLSTSINKFNNINADQYWLQLISRFLPNGIVVVVDVHKVKYTNNDTYSIHPIQTNPVYV